MRSVGDPDWQVCEQLVHGVPVGLGVDLPRTPEVFPPKVSWSLPEQPAWGGTSEAAEGFRGIVRDNYPTAQEYRRELVEALDDQVAKGFMVKMTMKEAQHKYGSRLTVASLSVQVKRTDGKGKREIRILHDATNGVDVNRYVLVVDGIPCPMSSDVQAVLRLLPDDQGTAGPIGLAIDAKEAHRLILIVEEDWGLLGCRADPKSDTVYLNKRGTYGVSSAAYWWGRLAALVHRAILIIVGRILLWLLLFADDWNAICSGPHRDLGAVMVVFLMAVFGVPLSWSKVQGGGVYPWIGYELSLDFRALGISERRAFWIIGWYTKVLDAGWVVPAELPDVLGRLTFVYGALPADRPFLAPIFAFASRVGNGTRPIRLPLYVAMVLSWLRRKLQERRSAPVASRPFSPTAALRVDAKAEGLEVALGGWMPVLGSDGRPDKSLSRWFSLRLTPSSAPWAFVRGLPSSQISTLEMLATTVGVVALDLKTNCPMAKRVQVTGLTDSQVSSNVVARGQTTAFPLCCVAMELAAQLEARRLDLSLDWVPRDSNSEADALADGNTDGFNPELRVGFNLEELPWLVLPGLLDEGHRFYTDGVGRQKPVPAEPRPAGRKRLRDREPW